MLKKLVRTIYFLSVVFFSFSLCAMKKVEEDSFSNEVRRTNNLQVKSEDKPSHKSSLEISFIDKNSIEEFKQHNQLPIIGESIGLPMTMDVNNGVMQINLLQNVQSMQPKLGGGPRAIRNTGSHARSISVDYTVPPSSMHPFPQLKAFKLLTPEKQDQYVYKVNRFKKAFEKIIKSYAEGKDNEYIAALVGDNALDNLLMKTTGISGKEIRAAQEFNKIAQFYSDYLKTILFESNGDIKTTITTKDQNKAAAIFGDFLQDVYGKKGFEIAKEFAKAEIPGFEKYIEDRSWGRNKVGKFVSNRQRPKDIQEHIVKIKSSSFNKQLNHYFKLINQKRYEEAYAFGKASSVYSRYKHLESSLVSGEYYNALIKKYKLPSKSPSVQKTLQTLMRQQKIDPASVVQHFIQHFTQDHQDAEVRQVASQVFDEKGVFKALAHDSTVLKNIAIPKEINNEEYVHQRMLLNNVVLQAQDKNNLPAVRQAASYIAASMQSQECAQDYLALAKYCYAFMEHKAPYFVTTVGDWTQHYTREEQQYLQDVGVKILVDIYESIVAHNLYTEQDFAKFDSMLDNLSTLQKMISSNDIKQAAIYLKDQVLAPLSKTPGFDYVPKVTPFVDGYLLQAGDTNENILKDGNPDVSMDLIKTEKLFDIDQDTYKTLMQDSSLSKEFKQSFNEFYQKYQHAKTKEERKGYQRILNDFIRRVYASDKVAYLEAAMAILKIQRTTKMIEDALSHGSMIVTDELKQKFLELGEFGTNLVNDPLNTITKAAIDWANGCSQLVKAAYSWTQMDSELRDMISKESKGILTEQEVLDSKLVKSLNAMVNFLNLPSETKLRLATDVCFDIATFELAGKAFGNFKGNLLQVKNELQGLNKIAKGSAAKQVAKVQKLIESELAFAQSLQKGMKNAKGLVNDIEAIVNNKIPAVLQSQKLAELTHTYGAEKVKEFIKRFKAKQPIFTTPEGLQLKAPEKLSNVMKKEMQQSGKVIAGSKGLIEGFNISEYHPSIGNLEKLEKAIKLFKDTPGAMEKNGPLRKALEFGKKRIIESKPGSLGTARGAMYELETALKLMEQGEEIINIGAMIEAREFDIITKNKIIECKNIDWSKKIGIEAERLQSNLGSYSKIALKKGKIFEFYSKNLIPEHWKKWLVEKGIKFYEG